MDTVKNKMHRVHTRQISSKATEHHKLSNIYIVELKIYTVFKNNPQNTVAWEKRSNLIIGPVKDILLSLQLI